MFIGHFGIGFGAKSVSPKVSLGSLFLAAQFLDLLWPTLLLLGIERVRIVPGATAVTPLIFEHYPISHSLLAVLGWAVLMGWVYLLLRRNRIGAFVLGMLVISHWGLVALVVFLLVIYGGNLFGAPPPSTEAIAWIGQLQWLLVLWGYWIDKHRHASSA